MAIRAVMFDMDGVLVDSEPVHFAVMLDALRCAGLPLPDARAWQRVFYGRPDRDGLLDWFALHQVRADVEQIMSAKLERFERRFAASVRAFDDGQWLARSLHARGVPLALVTGARRAEAELVLQNFELQDVFAASVSSDDVTIGKPDPEPYVRGAAALGVRPADCLVIEDAVAGLRAAEAAGARVIVVDRIGDPARFAPLTPVVRLDERVLETILGTRDAGRGGFRCER
jgi:HAD superfamily hydrolase (TIGR01509 family)